MGYGGPRMQSAGCDLLFDLSRLGVMFLAGALANFRLFLRLIRQAERIFSEGEFDAVVLIDYPGLNWWIARKASRHNIPVFYYGVPQMWAWAPWRIRKIRKFVDYVICKLPFEPKWFSDRGCHAHYVGHPYFDELSKHSTAEANATGQIRGGENVANRHRVPKQQQKQQKTLLLLPGSRRMELDRNLSTLFRVARQVRHSQPDVRVVMGCLNQEHQRLATSVRDETHSQCEIYAGRTLELMQVADACVACSGSVSLELLHYRVPTVIVYKLGLIQMLLQSIVIRCQYITLPNLMNAADIRKTSWWPRDPDASQEPMLMPEYLCWQDCSPKVSRWVHLWLASEQANAAKRAELDCLAAKYANPGASARAANFIHAKWVERSSTRAAA